jgi:predicted flap endonuclease-1-like 5' DNA nuclease
MKKNMLNESVFKAMNDAQQHFWDYLTRSVPALRASGKMDDWRQTYDKGVDNWESVVRQTLAMQTKWLEHWNESEAVKKRTPEAAQEWSRQVSGIMQQWVQVQTQFWDEMFRMMRNVNEPSGESAGGDVPAVEPPAKVSKAIPAAPAKPKKAAPAQIESKPKSAKKAATPKTPPAPKPASASSEPDDLKLLKGLGPVIEQTLNACGITTFRQIAELDEAAIKDLEANVLKSAGRFKRFDWVGQARELSGGK